MAGATVPDDVLFRIFGRLSFPDNLRVRELSKSWESNFFQVGKEFSNPIDCKLQLPCFYDEPNHQIRAFDPIMNTVKNIHGVSPTTGEWGFKATGCGALMVVFELNRAGPVAHVTNLVTRHTTRLECPIRKVYHKSFSNPILVVSSANGYELIIWFRHEEGGIVTNTNFMIYRSESGTWDTKSYPGDCLQGCTSGTYMDGNVYYILGDHLNRGMVSRFNVETGVTSHANLLNTWISRQSQLISSSMLRCGWRVLAVLVELYSSAYSLRVAILHTHSFTVEDISVLPLYIEFSPRDFTSAVIASSGTIYVFHPKGFGPMIKSNDAQYNGGSTFTVHHPRLSMKMYSFEDNAWKTNENIVHDWFVSGGVPQNLFVFQPECNPYILTRRNPYN